MEGHPFGERAVEGSHSHIALSGSSHRPLPTPGRKAEGDTLQGFPNWAWFGSLEEAFNSWIPGPRLQEVLIHLERVGQAESRKVTGATLIWPWRPSSPYTGSLRCLSREGPDISGGTSSGS